MILKSNMRIMTVLMVVLLSATLASPQVYRGRGRVKGKVTDTEGNPIEGVTVRLFHVNKQAGFEVKTNKNGEWLAAFIKGGQWNIDFEKPGYMPKKITVHLKELSRNKDIIVQLEKIKGPAIPNELLDKVEKSNELFTQKKYDEAMKILQDLAAQYPDVKVLHWNIGNVYFATGEYEKAIEHYMIAKDEYPNKAEFWMAVGNAYIQLKQFDKAVEAFNNIGIDKIDDPATLYNLGEVYFAQNHLDKAIEALKRAVELKPDMLDALYLLGTAYYSTGDKENARLILQQYLEHDSTSERAKEVKLILDTIQH